MSKQREPSVLFFGAGRLQKSILECAKELGLFTVAIDPDGRAHAKDVPHKFHIVRGDDFEETLRVAHEYDVSGIVTAATDKPLVMMARVAHELRLPFCSVETARISVDKLKQKELFTREGLPCAKGCLMSRPQVQSGVIDDIGFPLIVKPRDNSGSRGVVFCGERAQFLQAAEEAFSNTKLDTILVEEYIDGREYSIEALHFSGCTRIIQFTEKLTTPLPYNVELGHIQPAMLSDSRKAEIEAIVNRIARCLGFLNCASHTELKINEHGVCIIETSPRLGGDQITSTLTPLSTGISMEQALLEIAIGKAPLLGAMQPSGAAMIRYFNLPTGTRVTHARTIRDLCRYENVHSLTFELDDGAVVPVIKSSLDRYGEVVFSAPSRQVLEDEYVGFCRILESLI